MSGKVDIPQTMIEAAARAIFGDDLTLAWADADPDLQFHYRSQARIALAAAFAECEVRTEEQFVWPSHMPGDLFGTWHALGTLPPDSGTARRMRRLVITTPPVVVTPAQEETANG